MAQLSAAFGRDGKVIALVCVPHMLSHAYFLVLPPLFPVLKDAFGVSYTELGLALSVFGLAAGLGQIPVGFLVDRIGGRTLLVVGMAVQGSAIAMIGLCESYWQVTLLCGLAGAAHTVYHPADYAILTATVTESRLGTRLRHPFLHRHARVCDRAAVHGHRGRAVALARGVSGDRGGWRRGLPAGVPQPLAARSRPA